MYTPSHSCLRTCVHAQSIHSHPNTCSTHSHTPSIYNHETHACAHTPTVTFPSSTGQYDTFVIAACTRILPGKRPWGASVGRRAAGQTASHISAASLPWPVFVQLLSLPKEWGEGRKSNTGEGAGHCGSNQEFHTPNGTRAPISSWVKAQSWLCSQAAGDLRGPTPEPCPLPAHSVRLQTHFGGLFSAWVLLAPAGCPATGQRAPNGPQRPLPPPSVPRCYQWEVWEG